MTTEPAAGILRPSATRCTASRRETGARQGTPYVLDPAKLHEHIDMLYRAAWAMCGSRVDAEDLVQTTFAQVLRRPRTIRGAGERAYLLRALRNVHANCYRELSRRPVTSPLPEDDLLPAAEPDAINPRDLLEAIATAPPRYRDAVIAVDLLGLSYREASRSLRTAEKTVATRLYRGRQHVVRELVDRGVTTIDRSTPGPQTLMSRQTIHPDLSRAEAQENLTILEEETAAG
jgi:RNA polymerase sigma-70 factor (ECF subfamily)